jgi:putative transposase
MDRFDFPWQNVPDQQFNAFLDRLALVELLLDETVPLPDKQKARYEFMIIHKRKERTIRHWCQLYREQGTEALLFYRTHEVAPRIAEPELKEKILALIEEVPARSIPKIRELVTQDEALADSIANYSNRTIYRFLQERNLGKKQRRALAYRGPSKNAYHQFEAEHSLRLIQGDARDGIWLPGKNGKPRKTYLFLWIDDYSRKILFGKYYFSERLHCMEDSFKHAVLRYGIPQKCYLDNGAVYVSKQFAFVLKELECKKIHHKPFQAWCKGKVEVTNRTVKSDFQQEAAVAGIQTIEELNASFWAWAELVYNKRINSTTGEAPDDRFIKGLKKEQKRVTDIAWFQSLFLVRDTRTVSKYGKIKLHGNKYPITKSPILTVVGVRYDPCDLAEVHIFDQSHKYYLETTIPRKQVNLEAPHIPEERKKSKQIISKDSTNYFAKLREAYLKQQQNEQIVNFSQFYSEKKEKLSS